MEVIMATSLRAMLAQRRIEAAKNRILAVKDEAGTLSTQGALIIVAVVIGAVVGLSVLAALLPTFFGSLGDIGAVFSDANTTTGNADADALLPVFGLLIAFAGLFAIVGLALLVVKIKSAKQG
jgi:hypothetical protein